MKQGHKAGASNNNKQEDKQKYLYAEPKFMIPPDATRLPEPFKNMLAKE